METHDWLLGARALLLEMRESSMAASSERRPRWVRNLMHDMASCLRTFGMDEDLMAVVH